ncbi:MAG: hypothetical protein ACR2NP_22255 [Pirellulaceae bacterium]
MSHWLVQLILFAAWSTLWTLSAVFLGRFRAIGWTITNQRVRGDQIVLAASVVAILLVVGLPLVEATGRELSASYASSLQPVTDFLALAWWSILAAMIAVAASAFYRGNLIKGIEFVGLYLLAWCLVAATFDESRSAASAIRWLVPIGAFVAAGGSFLFISLSRRWNQARQRCGLIDSDESLSGIGSKLAMNEAGKQFLINLFLFASIVVVLAISSIATAQVLLTEAGVGALGGPVKFSWFGRLRAEVNYGVPGGVLTASVLLFAISQRRGWLAVAGSAVYQYVVIFSIVMLVFSVHPALATKRFVETLLAVSLGMTGYGFVWYWQRHRIGDAATVALSRKLNIRQIEFHTLINCSLVTSLAVLIGWRFFFQPDEAGGWINTAGGPMGIVALVAVVALAYLVWRERVAAESNANLIGWLCCWTGLVLTAMVAAIVDRASGGGQWIGFRVILWGSIVVSSALIAVAWLYARNSRSDFWNSRSAISAFPAVAAALVAVLFAMRGGWSDPTAFAQYMTAIGLVAILTSLIGWVVRDAMPSLVSAVSWLLVAITLTTVDPARIFENDAIDFINLGFAGLIALSLAWTGFYIWRRTKTERLPSGFVWLPNSVLLGASIWVLLGSLCEWAVQSNPGFLVGNHALAYPWGIATVAATAMLSAVHLWNDRNNVRVASPLLWSTGVAILIVVVVARQSATRYVWAMFAVGILAAMWGIVWVQRERWLRVAKSLKIPRTGQLRESMRIQLPVFSLSVGLILMLAAIFSMVETEDRWLRLLTAMTPLFVAVSIGCQSNRDERRWMQHLSLVLVTIGFVFTAWIDLVPSATIQNALQFAIRALLVLAGAVFVYGMLIARWVKEEDGWLQTLREMIVATCTCAFVCLAVVVGLESRSFIEGVGCGLSVAESVASTLVITGMIAGLIIIAVRPANDPFSLSLKGRMAYVYAAEVMVVLLVAHLYFTMPWLFQFGLRQYWPYIAIVLAFGGVWIAQILEQRNLTVLGEPIFHTAAILPVLVSALIWAIDSRADASLVLLMAGLAYLLISYTHQSALSGAAAIVLGNLALWVFYSRFPNFSFFDHPQLWLIPPAVSVLIAGHLAAGSLSRQQLALLRYLCVAVIYISSTFEIFISGIGDQLWPPMVLAVISILGIMLGMIFQVRAYLFLGSLFLLLAMITMVAHAHQSLNHVWPWWAFGVGMGVAILVMFGLFESRKHKIKSITGELQNWDL